MPLLPPWASFLAHLPASKARLPRPCELRELHIRTKVHALEGLPEQLPLKIPPVILLICGPPVWAEAEGLTSLPLSP